MPPFTQTSQEPLAFKTLIYGQTKTRKTLWACMFAELGFNVHVIQGDRNGAEIASVLSPEAQSRINVIDVTPTSTNNTALIDFLGALSRANASASSFSYNETHRTVFTNRAFAEKPGGSIWHINLAKLNPNCDLIVVDNLTNVARNLVATYAKKNGVDLTNADKPSWDGYGWCGRSMVHIAETLIQLNCPVILIGHEQQYIKYRNFEEDGKTKQVPEWEMTQPITTSGPNVAAVTHMFDPILLFTVSSANTTYIDATRITTRLAGSRFLPGKRYNWADLVPAKFFPHLRRELPKWQPSEAVTYTNVGPKT